MQKSAQLEHLYTTALPLHSRARPHYHRRPATVTARCVLTPARRENTLRRAALSYRRVTYFSDSRCHSESNSGRGIYVYFACFWMLLSRCLHHYTTEPLHV